MFEISASTPPTVARGLIPDIAFLMNTTTNTAMEAMIDCAKGATDFEVTHCYFDTQSSVGTTDVVAIRHGPPTNDLDNAWFRINSNDCRRMALLMSQGGNANRGTIAFNKTFYGGDGTTMLPCVNLYGDVRGCTVMNNNFEGRSNAVRLHGTGGYADYNMFLANVGEDTSSDNNPVDHLTGSCQGNMFIGGYCSSASVEPDGIGTWVHFDSANASKNIVIKGDASLTGETLNKTKIIDSLTTLQVRNTIINHTGPLLKYKGPGAGTTISDSDFPSGYANGNMAVGHNTTSGVSSLWVRANGTWKSVALS